MIDMGKNRNRESKNKIALKIVIPTLIICALVSLRCSFNNSSISSTHFSNGASRLSNFTDSVIFTCVVIVSENRHGNPEACASIAETGSPSNLDGIKSRSAACISRSTSPLFPKNITQSVKPSFLT